MAARLRTARAQSTSPTPAAAGSGLDPQNLYPCGTGCAVSNAKARAAGWTPAHPGRRTGFPQSRVTQCLRAAIEGAQDAFR